MTNKTRGIVILSVLCVSVAVAVAGFYWIRPYPIPKLEEVPEYSALGLHFAEERAAYHKLTETPIPENEKRTYLEQSIEAHPHNMAYMNELRIYWRDQHNPQAFIDYIEQVPASQQTQLQAALAYVDMLQDENLGTASLGQVSMSSIGILNELLDEDPHHLLARYARGLNNLYWPLGLRRTEKALQDLGYCLAVTQKLEIDHEVALWPHIYVAYGDALVKSGQVSEGIAVWKDGLALYPDHAELLLRDNVDHTQAEQLVVDVRGIDQFQRPDPDISDLSILWSD